MNKQNGQHNGVKKGGSKTPASNNKGAVKASDASASILSKEPANAKSSHDAKSSK